MKLFKKTSATTGQPPGTLVYVGKERTRKVKISIMNYNEKKLVEKEVRKIDDCFLYTAKPSITWINIDGVHKTDIIEKVGDHFKLHPLILEDIVNTGQRPKLEDFDDYLYIVLKMFYYSEKKNEVLSEQISLILGSNYVISFQEEGEDIFNLIRDRLRKGKGRIRKMGADYLAYALIDAVVDNYFVILEKFGERIEEMEDRLVTEPTPEKLQTIQKLKREIILLRKSVWPLRELVNGLERGESKLIKKGTGIFLRDVYDHTIQVIDTIETYRDMISGMVDLYLSSISNKMNQVMKILTIIATIFIPLTFIAGIYGMNFDPKSSPFNMPELGWYWGYVSVWVVMIGVAIIMIIYFRRKRWL